MIALLCVSTLYFRDCNSQLPSKASKYQKIHHEGNTVTSHIPTVNGKLSKIKTNYVTKTFLSLVHMERAKQSYVTKHFSF